MKKTVCLLTCLFVGSANAALISPESIVSNEFSTYSGWNENNLINQSGLNTNFIDGVTILSDYLLSDTGASSSSMSSNGGYFGSPVPGSIVFDLGQSYSISNFLLWNDTDFQGIDSFTLSISDDVTFGTVNDSYSYNATYGDINAGQDYSLPIPLQVFDVGSAGQYVRLEINSAHSNTFINFGEVAFDVETVSVPEPASVLLLGAGLAGICFSRKKKSS